MRSILSVSHIQYLVINLPWKDSQCRMRLYHSANSVFETLVSYHIILECNELQDTFHCIHICTWAPFNYSHCILVEVPVCYTLVIANTKMKKHSSPFCKNIWCIQRILISCLVSTFLQNFENFVQKRDISCWAFFRNYIQKRVLAWKVFCMFDLGYWFVGKVKQWEGGEELRMACGT